MNKTDPKRVWLEAVELVKDKTVAPTLYRALEAGYGIAVEEESFVVGFETSRYPMAGHLKSSQWMPIIEQVLSEMLGRKVRLITVEGTTPADYERYKEMIAANAAKQGAINARRDREKSVEQKWDDVADKIVKTYSGATFKMFPQSRAAVMKTGFRIINEAFDELGYSDDAEEIVKRSFAKMFEKFAGLVEMPPQWLVYEFFRLREEGKL